MLETTFKFQKAFRRMNDDANYENYFQEKKGDKGKRDGPPVDVYWENTKIFVKFLKTFYDTTLKFSGPLYVTSSSYFKKCMRFDKMLIS